MFDPEQLAHETEAITADRRRLRCVRNIEGSALVYRAMSEAIDANKKLTRLVESGGGDLRSRLFQQTRAAAERRALRLAALDALIDRYGMRDALARAEAS